MWLTADGVAVLDHDGVVGRRLRRRRHRDRAAPTCPRTSRRSPTSTPPAAPTLELSLDVKDPAAADRGRRGGAAPPAAAMPSGGCGCATTTGELVAGVARRCAEVRLVDSTRLDRLKEGPERRAATLREPGIDAVNLHHTDWTGGLTTLFHRFGVLAFGWDAQHHRVLDELLDIGHRRRLQRPRRPHGRRRDQRLPATAG